MDRGLYRWRRTDTRVNPLVLDPVPSTFPPINSTVASPFFAEIPPQGGSFLQSTLFYGPGDTATAGHAPPTFIKLVFPAGRLCFAGIGVSAQTPGAVAADSSAGLSSTLDCVDSTGTRLGIQTILPPPGVYTAAQPTPDGAVIFAGSAATGSLATTAGVVQPGFAGGFGNYTNPLAGGDAFVLRVSLSNPAPQITSVFPASVFLPVSATGTFTLTGTGFGYGTQVTWNGQNIASTFNSPTQVAITGATAGGVVQPGANQIGASLAGPGGGVSNPVTITGYNLPPGTLSISPSSVSAGSAETTVGVSGPGVSPNSVLTWNGSVRATTFLANSPVTQPGSFAISAGAGRAGAARDGGGDGYQPFARRRHVDSGAFHGYVGSGCFRSSPDRTRIFRLQRGNSRTGDDNTVRQWLYSCDSGLLGWLAFAFCLYFRWPTSALRRLSAAWGLSAPTIYMLPMVPSHRQRSASW